MVGVMAQDDPGFSEPKNHQMLALGVSSLAVIVFFLEHLLNHFIST